MDFSDLLDNVDWVAAIAAMVASMVWSFAWYSKAIVGGPWMKAVDVTEEDLQKAYMTNVMPVVVVLSFVSAFTTALVLQGTRSALDGIADGAILGVGFAASQIVILYAFALRPRNLWWMDGVWAIVNFALMGFVVSFFY